MDNQIILTCIFSSSVTVALITGMKDLILWVLNRKASKEDREEDRQEKSLDQRLEDHENDIKKILDILDKLEKRLDIAAQNDKVILKDRIKYLATTYIHEGKVSYDDKKNLKEMWSIYHYGLKGNGDLDDLMNLIDNLPLIV